MRMYLRWVHPIRVRVAGQSDLTAWQDWRASICSDPDANQFEK